MSAKSEQTAKRVAKVSARFTTQAVQAVAITCTECGGRATFPVEACPDIAERWAMQHRSTWHTGRTAAPKPLDRVEANRAAQ